MNAAVAGLPQTKVTWATATMAFVMMSVAVVLSQRRQRATVAILEATAARESRSVKVNAPRRPSHLPGSPRRRSVRPLVPPRPLRKSSPTHTTGRRRMSEVDHRRSSSSGTGLRVGSGAWNIVNVPYVSEGLYLAAGIISTYLSACGHSYFAVTILLLVFCVRLKMVDKIGGAPLLSDASKLHLLKSLNRETLHELLQDDLPRWVKFPDVEKCEWLNNTFDTLWPYVKVAVARSVKDALTPVLEGLKTSLVMTDIGFRSLDLGTAAPVINGIKSPQHLEEQVVIDIDLLIATQNTDVVFSFGNAASHIHMNVELSDFLLRGTLRVVMKPLFPRWPTFGAVSISFTEKPTINFQLKTLHLNLMELPALSSLFHNAISSAVENACVWPNKMLIPLVEDLSKVEIESLAANRPLGMLVVQNLRLYSVQPANRASRWTGKFSFHLQLSVGKEKTTTEVIRGQTQHDFGSQSFFLLVLDPKTQDLNIVLRYKEAFEKTHTIDAKWIHLDHLERRIPSKEVVAFGREGNGRAEFDLAWYPFCALSKTERKKSQEAPLPVEIASMGVVFIKLIKCERLPSMDLNGSSDPYVVFKVGSRKKQSSVKQHTLTPIWDPPEYFALIVSSDRHDELLVTIMDYDYLKADDEIGSVSIPLAQVQRSSRFVQTWMLENGSGSITLELEWKGF